MHNRFRLHGTVFASGAHDIAACDALTCQLDCLRGRQGGRPSSLCGRPMGGKVFFGPGPAKTSGDGPSRIGVCGTVSLLIVTSPNNLGAGVKACVLKRKRQQSWPISPLQQCCVSRSSFAVIICHFSGFAIAIDVSERSGQLRPYVRPVAWRSPLAIMGVRLRVRHQSVERARGT
jgi:hypothetical protein